MHQPGTLNSISGDVVDAAMRVHSALGPGLLESAYEACLAYELEKRGHSVLRQLPLPVVYEGIRLDVGYKIDLLIDGVLVVEIKAVSKLHPVHKAQLLSHLRMSRCPLGLLINFHELHLKDGIRRMTL
jgi:GxxExxY protein